MDIVFCFVLFFIDARRSNEKMTKTEHFERASKFVMFYVKITPAQKKKLKSSNI